MVYANGTLEKIEWTGFVDSVPFIECEFAVDGNASLWVMTSDGEDTECKVGDFLVRNPDGSFSVEEGN